MKFFVIFFFLGSSAFALPGPAPREKSFDLMKCTSAKLGTIWASFGHVSNSTEPEPRYFFTEVNVIDNSGTLTRARFWGPEEAGEAGATVVVGRGRMRLEFNGSSNVRHKLVLLNTIRNDPNSFMGNWERAETGEDSIFDQVACTAL